jgi:hypothetical protein
VATFGEFESLAQGDDGGVGRPEAEALIRSHVLASAGVVLGFEIDRREVPSASDARNCATDLRQ